MDRLTRWRERLRAAQLRRTMRRPDFLGIGAQRAGTTWLFEMLSLHPQLFLPAQKELHFFDERPDFDGYRGLPDPLRPLYHDLGSAAAWRWYLEQFGGCRPDQRAGEITPFYATLSAERVRLVARTLGRIKVIYILRDPVERAWSNLGLCWRRHLGAGGAGPLTEALIQDTIFFPAKLVHGDYRRNVGVWEAAFPPGSILYLFHADIRREPQAALDRVCAFLGVGPLRVDPARLAVPVNASPALALPREVEQRLEERFADAIAFVRERFQRELRPARPPGLSPS